MVVPLLVAAAAWTIAACAGGPTAPPGYRVAAAGYVERGATVMLTLLRGAVPVPAASVTWMGTPASIIAIGPNGAAQLLDTGTATVTAHRGTESATLALHVAVPPTIVFDMQDSGGAGNRDVYRMTLDGHGLVRLTSGAGDNEQPAVAGGTIVFTSYRDGYAALYRIADTGGTETRIPGVPAPASQASLSADGARLAFISPFGGVDHLWTAASDGSGATAVSGSADFMSALQASPSWAPAGDTLVVVTTQYGNAALARMAVASATETALTNGSTTDVNPAWSPDGHRVAFSSTRDGDLGVFALTFASGAVQRLTAQPGSDAEPGWLPDGRLVYTSANGATTHLRWLDPAHPDTSQAIPTPAGGNPHRASASR